MHCAKVEMDLAQVESLIEAPTETKTYEFARALDDARENGREWRDGIRASMVREAEPACLVCPSADTLDSLPEIERIENI